MASLPKKIIAFFSSTQACRKDTLLTALLALSGIVYISILQYNSFIEHNEGHAVERREHLHLLLGGLQEQTRDLTELLSNKWDFLDSLSTGNIDFLLNELTPFHDGLGYDFVAVYDLEGNAIARGDAPGDFGRSDELREYITKLKTGKKSTSIVTMYEGKLLLLNLKRLETGYRAIGVLAVGQYLGKKLVDEFARSYQIYMALQYNDNTVVSSNDAQLPKNIDLKEFQVQFENQFGPDTFLSAIVWEDISEIKSQFWHSLLLVIFIIAFASGLVIYFSRRIVTKTVDTLDKARITAEEELAKRKLAEEALKQLNQQLEERVEERTKHLEDEITVRKQIEGKLGESEEKYRSLTDDVLDSSAVGIFILDSDFRVVWVNQTTEVYFGLKRNEIIGKDKRQLIRERIKGIFEDPDSFTDKVFTAYDDNTYIECFECHVLPNGKREERWLEHRSQPIQTGLYAGGRIEHYYDITDRKQGQETLRERESQLRQIIDLVPHFIFVKDETGKFEIVNKATAEVFGTTVEDLTGRRDSEFVATEEEMEHFRSDDLEVIRSGKIKFIPEEPITDSENNIRYLQTTKVPFTTSGSEKPSLLGVAVDITRRVRAEEILALEKRRIAYILQGTNVGTWEWNVQTGETTLNERWAEIIGCTLEEISPVSIDTWMKFTHPDDLKVSGELLEKHFNGELDYYEYEARMRHKNGDWVWVLDRGKVSTWTEDGKPLLMSGTHMDINDRKRAEEQIAASLKEKEVLLREIHHRTKNNMQVMISLLKIQAANIEDKQVAEMFKESRDRIKSMALVHEKLYQSKGLADVDFKGYVKSLVSSIFSSYGANAAGITSITETDDVSIGLETAIPCGLIINELVSNSLKYAFPGNRKGEIRVALRSFDEDALVLEVGDNGIGMPEDLDLRNTASMGLHLVNILSEDQLHGKIELDRTGGTTFRIRFKNHKYEARI